MVHSKGDRYQDVNNCPDIEVIVFNRFQSQRGALGSLNPGSHILNDLGLDSVGLVVILLDLADQLRLDLSSARVTLKNLQTIADIIRLLQALPTEGAAD